MNRALRAGAVAVAVIIAGVVGLSASGGVLARDSDKISAEAFRGEMRRLWEDHIVWTRQYIVSAATFGEDLPDIGPTADRLFRNQADIGNAIAPFYGADAGAALTELLTDHIAIAAEAVGAARASNDAGLSDALERWYANADDIATFLSKANPQAWPLEMMKSHMRSHLDLTLEEAVARLNRDYVGDIAAYDDIKVQILEMADMLSSGIVAQFPSRFNR